MGLKMKKFLIKKVKITLLGRKNTLYLKNIKKLHKNLKKNL